MFKVQFIYKNFFIERRQKNYNMEATKKQESMSKKYKELFNRTRNLIISPKQEWEEIYNDKSSDISSILSTYILPYLGVLSLLTFISHIASHQDYQYASALKQALSMFASFFFGLYITYFITLNIIPNFTIKTSHKNIKLLAFKLIANSSIILYLIKIAIALIPQIYYLQALGLYSGYLIWLGTLNLGQFESKDLRIVFTIIVSVLILFVPYFISFVFMRFIGL